MTSNELRTEEPSDVAESLHYQEDLDLHLHAVPALINALNRIAVLEKLVKELMETQPFPDDSFTSTSSPHGWECGGEPFSIRDEDDQF